MELIRQQFQDAELLLPRPFKSSTTPFSTPAAPRDGPSFTPDSSTMSPAGGRTVFVSRYLFLFMGNRAGDRFVPISEWVG